MIHIVTRRSLDHIPATFLFLEASLMAIPMLLKMTRRKSTLSPAVRPTPAVFTRHPGEYILSSCNIMTHWDPSPIDPSAYGVPSRPGSAVSSSTDGAWRRRQTIKRGVTRKVKLTSGNFVTEYVVPTAIRNAVEPRWAATNTSEFTYVNSRPLITYLLT